MNILKVYFSIWLNALIGIKNRNKKLPPNSVLIVHGFGVGKDSGSPTHADMALEIYKKNKNQISYIIPSGFDSNPEFNQSEGKYMAEYLLKRGVPKHIILTEKDALTTPENIARALLLLKNHGGNIRQYNFISIHHPLYIWKALYIWHILGIPARGIPARCKINVASFKTTHSEIQKFLKDSFELEKAVQRTSRSHHAIKPLTRDTFLSLKNNA